MALALLGVSVVLHTFPSVPDLDTSGGEGNRNLREDQPHAWPQWLGPTRDGVSPETGLLAAWPQDGPPRLWEIDLGPGYSSCAIARGRLVTMTYVHGREVIVCLNADTGKTIWRRAYEASYQGMDGRFNQGPRSTPALDGDRVYTVGATGVFACWRLVDGAPLWRHDLRAEFEAPTLQWGVSFSPLIVKDLVYTNPGGKKGSLAAFDKMTGRLIWSTRDDAAGYSSPVLIHAAGKDQLLFFNATHVVSVAPEDGAEYWSLPWETSYDLNIATPLFIDGDIFISSGYGSGCARLRVLADAAGKLQVTAVWRSKRLSNQFTNSVYHQGHLYGSHVSDGPLVCLDYATGKDKWREAHVGRASLLVADGKLICLFEGGKLALVAPNTERYEELSSFQFSTRERCWAAPALANGKLYVRDGERLTCFDLRGG